MPRLEEVVAYFPRPEGRDRYDREPMMALVRWRRARTVEGEQREEADPVPSFRVAAGPDVRAGVVIEYQGQRFRATTARPETGRTGQRTWLDTESYEGPVYWLAQVTVNSEPVTVGGEAVGAFVEAD